MSSHASHEQGRVISHSLPASWTALTSKTWSSNMGSWSAAPSPYTSSVDTWIKRLMLWTFALSKRTCVPRMLFCVKEKELPKLLSTWVWAAKCMIVSISSSSST